jgi:predicted nucleic acid-binding protein
MFSGRYFGEVRFHLEDVQEIIQLAIRDARQCGMAAMDALHIATASLGGAEIFYTLEPPGKPMYRTSLVRVVHISAA